MKINGRFGGSGEFQKLSDQRNKTNPEKSLLFPASVWEIFYLKLRLKVIETFVLNQEKGNMI
jgi:hypothetical protein